MSLSPSARAPWGHCDAVQPPEGDTLSNWIIHRPKPQPSPVQECDLVLIVPRSHSRHAQCKEGEVRGKIGLCLGDGPTDKLKVLVEVAGHTDIYQFPRSVVVFVGRLDKRGVRDEQKSTGPAR